MSLIFSLLHNKQHVTYIAVVDWSFLLQSRSVLCEVWTECHLDLLVFKA